MQKTKTFLAISFLQAIFLQTIGFTFLQVVGIDNGLLRGGTFLATLVLCVLLPPHTIGEVKERQENN